MVSRFILQKLREPRIWARIARERLAAPLSLNLISVFVGLFGSFRAKVEFDLVVRNHHAWSMLYAADQAKRCGIGELTAVEFGVANGAGLLNMCEIAARVTRETGVHFHIVGFDAGTGLPRPADYRDHPEHYHEGDYPMVDRERLLARLPGNARVIFGDVRETAPAFLAEDFAPIGFVSFDLDYYSSTRDALSILDGAPERYLPWTVCYFDDVHFLTHNEFQGALLALKEFNASREDRKLAPVNWLDHYRLFHWSAWVRRMYFCHMFQHPFRTRGLTLKGTSVLSNPYLP
jgi:hypothetical protein